MMDKIKTVLLVLLISTSLLQSYLLAYSKPNLDPIHETEYIETELLGEQQEFKQMIFPQQIVLHFGENQHTVLYPNHKFYNMIFNKVKQRSFDGFKEISQSSIEWDQLRSRNQGVEIHFKDGIPLTMLENMMQLRGEPLFGPEYIDRIWMLTADNQEEVRTFFFAASGLSVYESTKADLTVKDIEQFVGLGSYLPNYQLNYSYYLPTEPMDAIEYKMSYHEYTPEQLQNSLFVDPGISRKILERDGTEIITDGKRGLKVDHGQGWMNYSDPVTSVEFGNDVRENLLSAVQFVNRHGGWNGEYLVNHAPLNRNQSFVFRQYMDSLPIYSPKSRNFGYIKIILQKGIVSSYERSLLNLDYVGADKKEAFLPGGEQLNAMIQAYAKRASISSIQPAYIPTFSQTEDSVILRPKWTVELFDGSVEVLE
jgi:regulatory protein YycH of two-component signal transduction system YycFG